MKICGKIFALLIMSIVVISYCGEYEEIGEVTLISKETKVSYFYLFRNEDLYLKFSNSLIVKTSAYETNKYVIGKSYVLYKCSKSANYKIVPKEE